MRIYPSFLFRHLLTEIPRGTPLSTDWLQKQGLLAKQTARFAKDGWLKRLGQGVYLLSGDTLDRDATLAFLAQTVPGLHVAGKTAMAWRSMRHNAADKETLVLWGDKTGKLPTWFTTAFPCHYQGTHIFDDTMPAHMGLAPLSADRPNVLVSVSERALLELLSDVGKRQGLEEARPLVESMGSLYVPVLEALFAHITRIKVVRLAYSLAEEFDLPWKALAREHCLRLGGGKRWVSVSKSGMRLDLKGPQ